VEGVSCDLRKMDYALYQQDRLPIRVQSKNLACSAFGLMILALYYRMQHFFSQNNLACGAFFCTKKILLNHSVMHLISSFKRVA